MHLADAWKQYSLSPLNDRPGTRRKVCIYGAGLGKHEAPLGDPEWDVWALNLVAPIYKQGSERFLRADRWFDLHQRKAQTSDDMRWIAECPVPIYVPPDLMDASPRTLRFPLEEIEAMFGSYWAVSFAYQVALVMWMNATNPAPRPSFNHSREDSAHKPCTDCRIAMDAWPRYTHLGLYGVELAHGTERERTFEWACLSYWIGRAEQSGIEICLPENSLLGRHFHRYGFEYTEELEAVKAFDRHNRSSDADNRSESGWKGDVGGR